MDSFVMLAVPLFTLAGYLMEQGGLSRRLVDWVEKIFGRYTGATGTITIICCAIFASLTGSGPATVAAIGAVMMPALIQSGYPKHIAAGMLASGGALGPIIPPSVAMIVYGSTMNVSIPKMFIGALVPGLCVAGLFVLVNLGISYKRGIRGTGRSYTIKEIVVSTWRALGVLLLPVIVLGGIYGGFFTPTEAATICVVYSMGLGFALKELSLTALIATFKKTIVTSSAIAMIIGISSVFGWILAAAKIPASVAQTLIPILGNANIYMLVLMLVLFVVGCLMETLAAIVIIAPILVPIGLQMGVDPLHLGVIFCINLIVGFVTPPFGVNLFTAVSTTDTPYTDVVRGSILFLIPAVFAIFIFAFIPEIILFLPRLLS
jgi:C4-dicarboxylate transporter DctM subunit